MKNTSALNARQLNVEQRLAMQLPSPLVALPVQSLQTISVFIKRDDQIHPVISGNKWRKLQGIFQQWHKCPQSKIVSFGGGYSNHLHALAYACHQLRVPFTAMIRGNYSNNLTPMLKDIQNWGAEIRWLSRVEYQQKTDSNWVKSQLHEPEKYLIVPEGGSGQQVHEGMRQLVSELPEELDYLLCPVGSGGTLAGIIQSLWQRKRKTRVIGIAVLKGQGYLENLVTDLITEKNAITGQTWQINHDFHFGGYAKSTPELTHFCTHFNQKSGVEIEPVYSGKLFFALYSLLEQGFFGKDSRVAAIHTGGIQGDR